MSYEEKFEKDLLQKLAAKGIYYSPPAVIPPMPKIRATYQAGVIDRLTASFGAASKSADSEILASLSVMRARSRTLSQNNVYMRKFLGALKVNIIGDEGIKLQSVVRDANGNFDKEANNAIEQSWADYCSDGVCDVTGEYSMNEIYSLALESAARDGDVFLRIVRGWKENKYRFAVQLIENDYLDEKYNRELPNKNKIIMGVEKDAWGRRVNYHFLTRHPGDYYYGGSNYNVIPASDIIPLFMSERAGQTRGVPWSYAAMIMLNNIGAFAETAIIAARCGAAKMGFYKTSDDGDLSKIATGVSDDGDFIDEVEPGVFTKLPVGWDFKEFNPDYPRGEFSEFNKAMLKGAASGLLMAYSSISSDLSDVNFSSIRSGKLEERDIYKFLQKWFIRKIPNKIFPQWLDVALMTGRLKLPYAKFEKFNNPTWQARGFEWVDPKKDIEAEMLAINFGLKTRSEVVASRGKDLRDVFEQLKREQDLAAELGLTFSSGKTEAAARSGEEEDNGGQQSAAEKMGGNNDN